jgi:murein DD-endopeptidase MepM/ murein hydrolase activator NlpD
MSLPVFYREQHRSHSFGATPRQWAVTAVLLFCIALGLGAAAGRVWTDVSQQALPLTASPSVDAAQVEAIRLRAEHQIAALTAKVASLQAQVNRLNMVGERLIDAANLSLDEFDLHAAPAIGGPAQTPTEISLAELNHVLLQLTDLEQNLQSEQTRFALLESLDLNHNIGNNSQLSGRPVKSGYLSSGYGIRNDPFTGRPAVHKGVDFAGDEGDPVYATAGGIVTWAGERFGYGLMVEIEHADGYRSRYGHAKSVNTEIGSLVSKGQQIATLGNTGRSTGPHVHYEVLKDGQQIDPMLFVNRRTKNLYGSARTARQSQQ